MSLVAENISFARRGRPVLRGVSLTLRPGAFTAVAGPNGAGKSTLLGVLTRELRAAGTVQLDGRPLTAYAARELARRRAVLPQRTPLNFPFRVREVVALGRAPYPTATPFENEQAISAALRATGTQTLAHRPFHALSGGEQQRVHLGRVLAQIYRAAPEPRYLLLDEPTASLDIAQQHYLLSTVRQTCRAGVGVLAIVHDLNLAAAYADDLLLLRDGAPVAYGPVAEVLRADIIEKTYGHPVRVVADASPPYVVAQPFASLTDSLIP